MHALASTLMHAVGLKDDKGGERQLLVGVDDALVKTENRTVPREDVAEVRVHGSAVLKMGSDADAN